MSFNTPVFERIEMQLNAVELSGGSGCDDVSLAVELSGGSGCDDVQG